MHALAVLQSEVAGCTRCRLSQGRTQVVFGSGSPDADLMFVGEAPGFHEDQQGVPFVGQAGQLLEKLLNGIGLTRADVYIANVLKCRPPGNRDPQPDEIEACESHLFRQVELIQPKLVGTLGNFATKTSARVSPIPSSSPSSSLPAWPTNGTPCLSSWNPGASPTNIRSALGEPAPNTTCVRPCESAHFVQSATASR